MLELINTYAFPFAITALILGGFIALLNFFLSFLRPPIIRRLGWPPRNISGIPLVGSFLLLPAAIHFAITWQPEILIASAVLILLDTGGIAWLIPILIHLYVKG
ncbi:MAG TPA: hypothetical protein VGL71_02795 [Urbifossiella sp.]|jgi:hypothetical protein